MVKRICECLILSALVLVSCQEELPDFHLTEGEPVPVAMDLILSDIGLATKAIVDPDVDENTTAEDVIHNFWVLQFDGVGDDARILGEPKYYSSYEKFIAPVDAGGYGGVVELIPSEEDNTVFIFANSFDPLMVFRTGSTIAELKQMKQLVDDETDFMAEDVDGNRYPMMSAFWTGTISSPGTPSSQTQKVSCVLKRNVARLDIRIINSSADVTIKSWQLKSVPSISLLTTNYELPSTFPSLTDYSVFDYPVQTPVSPMTPVPDGSTEEFYRTYVPVNIRGNVANDAGPQFKNVNAPKNSTYLLINASYGDGIPISYTFYLGADLESDFNLRPNCLYQYVFDIRAKGDAKTDMRVKELGVVDFTTAESELANCYILNPAPSDRRLFKIPVSRVNQFWGGNGYEDESSYTLNKNTEWVVELIAYNFDNSDNKVTLAKNTGKGITDENGDPEYFAVSVKENTIGNAIVAIYPASMDPKNRTALWSWHLWITNYSPDEALQRTPEPGVYDYGVTGGVVHRYEGAAWRAGGIYENSFIMDRNLGASDSDYHKIGDNYGNGVMYYQFGRKDPMFGTQPVYGTFGKTSVTESTIQNSMKYSVMYPLNLIYPGSRSAWTKGNIYNPTSYDSSILWQDPHTRKGAANEGGKSIFDPCPPGYCVPQVSAWSDFRANTKTNPTTNARNGGTMLRGFPGYNETSNIGSYYWPYVEPYIEKVPENPVYYPASGYKDSSQGVASDSEYLYSVSSNPNGVAGMFSFVHRNADQSIGTESFQRNLAFPVRCVSYVSNQTVK